MTRNVLVAILWVCVTACLGLAGCGRKTAVNIPPVDPASPATAAESASQPASEEPDGAAVAQQPERPPPPPTPTVIARAENTVRQNVVGEVDAFLTAELRNFVQQKHRLPATFAEFAGIRLDTIPRPPAGKKWVIDTENLEVKAVASP